MAEVYLFLFENKYFIQISANQIHISAAANHLLTEIIGGYITQARGEQLIKVKISSNVKRFIKHFRGKEL